MKVAIFFAFWLAFLALISVEALFPLCPGIVIRCDLQKEGCRYKAITGNDCNTCTCLPPKKSCPQLKYCRKGCSTTYFLNSKGCPECHGCPVEPSGCTLKCNDDEIKGNPDENGCDTCLSSPKCDRAIKCQKGCKQVNDENGCPVNCIDCPLPVPPACSCDCNSGSPLCDQCACAIEK